MTLQAIVDDQEVLDIATNKGWSDFIDWIEGLPEDHSELRHLTHYGWNDQLLQMSSELEHALNTYVVGADVESVGRGLLSLCDKGGEVIVISDGMVEDGGLRESS